MVGKITRVPLRELWAHEGFDFTKWLQDNVDVLSEAVDLSLSSAEREQSAGDFRSDLVAEDEAGDPVVIENQLDRSDHAHLGKLLTYLTAIGAKTAIWIVADPRPEHVGAIAWLNEASSASFYLLKVEGVRIGDSPPAPLLTLIVGPSAESREAGATKKEMAERYTFRREFWAELLARAKQSSALHAGISPSTSSYVGAGAGKAGLSFDYTIRQHDGAVELYIDRGKGAEDENNAIFDALATDRDAIEASFGGPLDWARLEGKRACRIKQQLAAGGYRDRDAWPAIQEAMVEAMARLEKALKPRLAHLRV